MMMVSYDDFDNGTLDRLAHPLALTLGPSCCQPECSRVRGLLPARSFDPPPVIPRCVCVCASEMSERGKKAGGGGGHSGGETHTLALGRSCPKAVNLAVGWIHYVSAGNIIT